MRIAAFIYFSLIFGSLYAQKDSVNINELDEVLLFGNEQTINSINKELFSVNTISAQQINQVGANNLADILNQQLNISITPNAADGRSTVSMFGLSGDYVKILVDNVPLVSDNGYGNNIDLTQINLEDIARIEIAEGAMGVLYGDNAVAGVINIITKKSSASKWNIRASVQEETVGEEYNFEDEGRHIQNLNIAHNISDHWYASANFSRNDFNGFKNNYFGRDYFGMSGNSVANDGRRGYEWNPKLQHTLNGMLKFAKNDFNFFYKFNYYNETLDIYNHAINTRIQDGEYDITANDEQFVSNRFRHEAQAFGNLNQVHYNLSLSYQTQVRDYETYVYDLRRQQKRSTTSKMTNQESDLWFSKGTFENLLSKSANFNLTAGYEITYQQGYDAVASGAYSDNIAEQDLGNYDVFSQLSFTKNNWSIYPGVRYNHNSNYDGKLIWSTSANYKPAKDLKLQAVVGSAYKTPTFTNLYYYFVDANHDVRGNPDLKPEDGISYLISAEKTSVLNNEFRLQNNLKFFHFDIQDKIDLAVVGDNSQMEYLNISEYKILGVSTENNFSYKNFQTNIGLSYTGISQSLETELSNPDDYLFSLNATAALRYYWPKAETRFSLLLKYNGELQQYFRDNDTNEFVKGTQEDYSLMDASINKYFFKKRFEVTLGARNLFNVVRVNNSAITATSGHEAPSTSLLFGYGRSYFLKLLYNLNI
ncbi:TonB-dependent receptor plug domain-containing protein [Zunongwangia atlantica]|uniref:TonB-dependent outer membrane receptor n=1 Tax=Zunongwangia atlantica 22II14-10F7 TaxID=1185767 RepID=A0A1Y1T1S4_9FLAO|nr:TonB-dependent receptor [Zunongwangia atlantica]ORL44742.1 TonB-dependent outer membrane receptor [Zunongwangia atlantica 22II14-10F7]